MTSDVGNYTSLAHNYVIQITPNVSPTQPDLESKELQDMAVALLEEGSSFRTGWDIQRNDQLLSETISCRSPNSLCFRVLILSSSFKC